MKSDDLVPFLTAQPPNDLGFRQGTLVAWDSATEANTVQIAGQTFTDLPVLAVGTLAMAAGDLIGVLRYKSTYLILGRIAPAGSGSLQNHAAQVYTAESYIPTSYGNLATTGPTVTAYIGSSRQCVVLLSTAMSNNDNDFGLASFTVTGASSIPADDTRSVFSGASINIQVTVANSILLTAGDGLNPGLNTFQMKYRTFNGSGMNFRARTLTVIPF